MHTVELILAIVAFLFFASLVHYFGHRRRP
jgi:hypothetical protein